MYSLTTNGGGTDKRGQRALRGSDSDSVISNEDKIEGCRGGAKVVRRQVDREADDRSYRYLDL